MAKKIIRLTESDLTNIVKRVIKEQNQMSGQDVFEFQTALNDYFKMTYSDIDYVTFHVQSFIFPPEKSNKDKFFELFGMG